MNRIYDEIVTQGHTALYPASSDAPSKTYNRHPSSEEKWTPPKNRFPLPIRLFQMNIRANAEIRQPSSRHRPKVDSTQVPHALPRYCIKTTNKRQSGLRPEEGSATAETSTDASPLPLPPIFFFFLNSLFILFFN